MSLDPIINPVELKGLGEFLLFDCRPDAHAYREGHVRGAIQVQLERDLSAHVADAAQGGRHPLPDVRAFANTLGRWGVTPSTQVVAYDDQNGANAAARLWWLLKAVGHRSVRVVDGGLPALVAAGFALTTDEPSLRAVEPYPVFAYARPLADIDEVERARTDVKRRVIDVRAAFRYRGESEPIDPVAGHIPGAQNVPLTDNLQSDGTFKGARALRAMYEAALSGVDAANTIVHCGSGVTACHTLLALERAGLEGAKLYVGSWSEWCRNEGRAREPSR